MFHNDEPKIQHYLSLVSEVGCEQELEAEVSSARLLLYRLEKQRDLLSQSLLKYLSKPVITEIRSLGCPPALVKELIMATLLLLGYTEEQAKVSNLFYRLLFHSKVGQTKSKQNPKNFLS